MRIAIMQPYFLPYIGYYQLVAAVDRLVILDDVNYVNRGWINRNILAWNQSPHWMTIPLLSASQNTPIRNLAIAPDSGWKKKLKSTVDHFYCKAPMFHRFECVFRNMIDRACGNLADYLRETLNEIFGILDIRADIIPTADIYPKNGLKGQDRIIQICKELGAHSYVNLPGGQHLYRKEDFHAEGISLFFIEPDIPPGMILSGLPGSLHVSILDLMMRNSPDLLRASLRQTHVFQ